MSSLDGWLSGKFKDSEKDVMIAEMGPFLSYFQESVHPVLFAKQVQRTDGVRASHYILHYVLF